jgi:hypothetical protein
MSLPRWKEGFWHSGVGEKRGRPDSAREFPVVENLESGIQFVDRMSISAFATLAHYADKPEDASH